MMQSNSLSSDAVKFLHEISSKCYNVKVQSLVERELICAKIILIALNQHYDLLFVLGEIHFHDFNNSIIIHGNSYLEKYRSNKKLSGEAISFENSLNQLKKNFILGKEKILLKDVNNLKGEFVRALKKIQLFFSDQSNNKESLEFIYAISIVYEINNIQEKEKLVSLLLLIKELWCKDYHRHLGSNQVNILDQFYLDFEFKNSNAEEVFYIIVSKLTSEKDSMLLNLQNNHILKLYDRLKNHKRNVIFKLLEKLYVEAQYRYSCNRLSDTGYQLLTRFQNFDAINRQIEDLEFGVLEAYLFKRSKFTKEILICIAKHSHNIKALSVNKNENLLKIIAYIDKKLKFQESGTDGSMAMLSNLKDSLNKVLPTQKRKHYSGLDKFHNVSLQKKYSELFGNIVAIFEEKGNAKGFLQRVFTCRLASGYYLPHLSNSINLLRKQALGKKEVVSLLSDLNFLLIFSPGNFNKIKSFSFQRTGKVVELKSPAEYVESLIHTFCMNINAFQLETMYKSIINKHKLTLPQKILMNAIKAQIKQRMTLRKLLYSMFSGKKKEYNRLKLLKKMSAKHQAKEIF